MAFNQEEWRKRREVEKAAIQAKFPCNCERCNKGWTCRTRCDECGYTNLMWEAWGHYLDKDLICQNCKHTQDIWNC